MRSYVLIAINFFGQQEMLGFFTFFFIFDQNKLSLTKNYILLLKAVAFW